MLTDYEGSAYSVDTALSSGKTFDGYTFDTLKGAPSGKLNKDTGINVYFVKKSTPTEPSKLTEPNTPTDPTTPAQTATNIPDSTTPADTQIFDTQVPLTNTPTAGKTHGGPEVPPPAKAEAPRTGDSLPAALLTAAASLGGVLVLSTTRKKNA